MPYKDLQSKESKENQSMRSKTYYKNKKQGLSKLKTQMDRDEGLKPYQKHGIIKPYKQILQEARTRDPETYKQNKYQHLCS